MSTIKSILQPKKPVHRRNFIKENVKQLKNMQNLYPYEKDRLTSDGTQKVGNQRLTLRNTAPSRSPKGYLSKPGNQPQKSKFTKTCHQTFTAEGSQNISTNLTSKSSPRENCNQNTLSGSDGKRTLQKCNEESSAQLKNRGDITESTDLQDNTTENSVSESSDESYTSESSVPRRPENTPFEKFKDNICQTANPNSLEGFLEDGVILYPSKNWATKKFQSRCDAANQTEKIYLQNAQKSSELARTRGKDNLHKVHDLSLGEDDAKNKHNFERSSQKCSVAMSQPKSPQQYQRGIVPRYLRGRQEEWFEKEIHEEQSEQFLMPDNERQEKLKIFQATHADLVTELRKLPVTHDTLRIRQRKRELEEELKKVEEAIRIFSHTKVLVQKCT